MKTVKFIVVKSYNGAYYLPNHYNGKALRCIDGTIWQHTNKATAERVACESSKLVNVDPQLNAYYNDLNNHDNPCLFINAHAKNGE